MGRYGIKRILIHLIIKVLQFMYVIYYKPYYVQFEKVLFIFKIIIRHIKLVLTGRQNYDNIIIVITRHIKHIMKARINI